MTEKKLQARIINDLESRGWEVVKVIRCNKSGWPDIQAHKNKITVFIECKAEGKEARPLQVYQHQRLQRQGFEVFVFDTWEAYFKCFYI